MQTRSKATERQHKVTEGKWRANLDHGSLLGREQAHNIADVVIWELNLHKHEVLQ